MCDETLPDLLPCPFCGAGAIVCLNTGLKECVSVECEECKADSAYCRTPEEAIAAWNRRAATPSPDATEDEIERMAIIEPEVEGR